MYCVTYRASGGCLVRATVTRMEQAVEGADGRLVVDRAELAGRDTRRFAANRYPYAVPEGTRHFVLWYSEWPEPVDDARINADIHRDIRTRVGRCDAAWPRPACAPP